MCVYVYSTINYPNGSDNKCNITNANVHILLEIIRISMQYVICNRCYKMLMKNETLVTLLPLFCLFCNGGFKFNHSPHVLAHVSFAI